MIHEATPEEIRTAANAGFEKFFDVLEARGQKPMRETLKNFLRHTYTVAFCDGGIFEYKRGRPDTQQCTQCAGCGRIDDTKDGAPWSTWTDFGPTLQGPVVMGLVKPIQCPRCQGSGIEPGPTP